MGTAENKELIREAFGRWEKGDVRPFFRLVSKQVRWTVIGSTPISGTYEDRATFFAETDKLFDVFADKLKAKVVDVLADGDKVVVQWEGHAPTKSGKPYNQVYCWVLTMDEGEVAEVIAYLDTELVSSVME